MSLVFFEDEIEDEFEACSYCRERRGGRYSCCGENHFDLMYQFDSGWYYQHEVTILPGCRPLTDEQKDDKAAELAYEIYKDEQE